MTQRKQHTHKYQLIKVGSYTSKNRWEVYKCMLPGCTHHITKELALGRDTICWACGTVFQIKKNRMIKKPTCGCRAKFKQEAEVLQPQLIDLIH